MGGQLTGDDDDDDGREVRRRRGGARHTQLHRAPIFKALNTAVALSIVFNWDSRRALLTVLFIYRVVRRARRARAVCEQ